MERAVSPHLVVQVFLPVPGVPHLCPDVFVALRPGVADAVPRHGEDQREALGRALQKWHSISDSESVTIREMYFDF